MFTHAPPRARLRAFSLIELLIVVAVIALLISILLPALARAREHSKDTACRANCRMILVAASEYWNDWNMFVGYVPGIDRKMLLYPYLNQGSSNSDVTPRQVWNCPSNLRPLTQCGYGFNTALNWVTPTQVQNWPQTVALCDAGLGDNGTAIADTLTTMASPPDKIGAGASLTYRPNPRHLGAQVNVGFVDIHVESLPVKDPFYPGVAGTWWGNGVTNPASADYKDSLWDLN